MSAVPILLAEDSAEDVDLIHEAFEIHDLPVELHPVRDGVEALRFLRREADYADAPWPGLMLLDLNMPRKDGREVLAEVKSDAELRHLPVLILTTSDAEADIVESYNRRANAYLTKPTDFDDFLDLIRYLGEFWLTAAQLPPRGRH
ncbi:response regulator [Thiohalorhabdus sp. Cl-TMA]|uniref:Response regulator n=1 Tax=Thiohalorhabdus methylotrophus TaxID=3242694 RepID=A0ABV4TX87_9GAMM